MILWTKFWTFKIGFLICDGEEWWLIMDHNVHVKDQETPILEANSKNNCYHSQAESISPISTAKSQITFLV